MIAVREARAADAPVVADLLRRSFEPFRDRYTDAAFRATTPPADTLRERLAQGPVWLASVGGAMVGTVSAALRRAEVYVRSMAVVPEARGGGVGRRLLLETLDYATLHDAVALTLCTTPFLDTALGLYLRHGFLRTGQGDLHGTPLIHLRRALPVTRLVVYGSLRPGGKHHDIVQAIPGRWREGWIMGRLEEEGWAAASGYPRIRPDAGGDRIAAWMLESPDLPAHWNRLDEFEGADYRRRPVLFHTPRETVEGYGYVGA